MSELVVKHRRRFGVVPDHILENKAISLEARAVAAWLAGRQPGFTIMVEAMKDRFLGLTDRRWKSIRKQLEEIGWWRSSKIKSETGKFIWRHEFSDDGFSEGEIAQEENSPILSSRMGGNCSDSFCGDAQGSNAKRMGYQNDDYHHDVYQYQSTTTDAGKAEVGVQELLEAAIWDQKLRGGPVSNPAGWRVAVRKRLELHGASEEDLEIYSRWCRAKEKLFKAKQSAEAKSKDEVPRRRLTDEEMKKLKNIVAKNSTATSEQCSSGNSGGHCAY